MKFEEILNKYLQDDNFKEEVKTLIKNNNFKEAILKYDLPYSESELVSLIDERAEAANCKDKKRIAELEERIAYLNSALKTLEEEYSRLKARADSLPGDHPTRRAINAQIYSVLSDINSKEREKRELEEELRRIK